jgi:predicted Zn-dependent protease
MSIELLRIIENAVQLASVLAHEATHTSQKQTLQTLELSQSLQGASSLTFSVMDKKPDMLEK